MGVFYQMEGGGSQILVPKDKVLSTRMKLAEDGLPTGGATVGYEIFDKSETMGTSSFVQNVNLIRALEGELGRTITSFEKVAAARVHLVIPKKDLFSKRKQMPSASVILKLQGGRALKASEISAISHLVATAVPELGIEQITIVDTKGRPFKRGSKNSDDPSFIASNNEEIRQTYEKHLEMSIIDLLERSVGAGRVQANVTAQMNFDRVVTNAEIYDPDGQVARSVQTTEESDKQSNPAGTVTAANNIPGGENGASGGDGNSSSRIDEVKNFEISKTIKQHVQQSGTVDRLSIAVLIDGKYTYNEETEEEIYSERTPEDLKMLETLVKSAVGYDEDRGDVVEIINMRFTNEVVGMDQEDKLGWLTDDLGSIVQTLIIGLITILVIFLIVKPIMGKAFEVTKSEAEQAEVEAALSSQELDELAEITGEKEGGKLETKSLIDVDKFEEKMNKSSVGAINDIVDRHPDESVTIIRNWLEEDNKA
jgi:flagellar M-ring protein FliF